MPLFVEFYCERFGGKPYFIHPLRISGTYSAHRSCSPTLSRNCDETENSNWDILANLAGFFSHDGQCHL